MKKIVLMTLACSLLFLACEASSSGSGSGGKISGTVSLTAKVKVGSFSGDYWFTEDYMGEEDVVYREFATGTTGSFAPLEYVEPDEKGRYTLALPSDVTDTGDVIAWIDANGDGLFDLGTEAGYFPIKEIDGTLYVVSFGYMIFGDTETYLVSYDTGQNDDIELVGYSGYNFTLD